MKRPKCQRKPRKASEGAKTLLKSCQGQQEEGSNEILGTEKTKRDSRLNKRLITKDLQARRQSYDVLTAELAR